jgi:hypothetical protein
MVKRRLSAMIGAALLPVIALIQAEKNMVFVVVGLCHGAILVLCAALA